MSSQVAQLKRIDIALEEYYKQLGHSNYRDEHNRSKFMAFIINEQLNDEELPIAIELGDHCDPNDCTYTYVYENTPFPAPAYVRIANHKQKQLYIFYMLQYCHNNGLPPPQSCMLYNNHPAIKYSIQ